MISIYFIDFGEIQLESKSSFKAIADKPFEKIGNKWDITFIPFLVLDNITINKQGLNICDRETLNSYYGKSKTVDIDKELIDIEDFNFYLEHNESALESLLNLEFLQFYKNIVHNQSVKKFIKGFLSNVQKHGNSLNELSSLAQNDKIEWSINIERFNNIVKLVLKVIWNIVSNKAVSNFHCNWFRTSMTLIHWNFQNNIWATLLINF